MVPGAAALPLEPFCGALPSGGSTIPVTSTRFPTCSFNSSSDPISLYECAVTADEPVELPLVPTAVGVAVEVSAAPPVEAPLVSGFAVAEGVRAPPRASLIERMNPCSVGPLALVVLKFCTHPVTVTALLFDALPFCAAAPADTAHASANAIHACRPMLTSIGPRTCNRNTGAGRACGLRRRGREDT